MCFRNQPWTPAFLWDALKENCPHQNHRNPWWRGIWLFLVDLSACVLVQWDKNSTSVHIDLCSSKHNGFLQRISFSAYVKVTFVEKNGWDWKKKMLREGISNNSETELDLTQFHPLTLLRLHKRKRLNIPFCTSAFNSSTQTTSGYRVETSNTTAGWENMHQACWDRSDLSCTSAWKRISFAMTHQSSYLWRATFL